MKLFIALFSALILSSCATMFNSQYCKTDLQTDEPMIALIDSTSFELKPENANVVTLTRSKNPKEIILIRDTKVDTVLMKSSWSYAYYFNFYSLGIGFLIDGKTPKKWGYPSIIFLTDRYISRNLKGANPYINNKYAEKGAVNFRVSFPEVNLFYSAYENENIFNAGFMGISLGLDYFYNNNAFLSISGSAIMDFLAPVPAPVDYGGILNHLSSTYCTFSNNHTLFKKRLSLGYGLSCGLDQWNTINHGMLPDDATEEEIEQESIYRQSTSLGLAFSAYYYTNRSFYMGIVYRPMFVQFAGKTQFKYQCTASFDFGWRIRLRK